MKRWVIVVFSSLLLVAAPAAAQYIGIFQDAGATTCVAQVGPAAFIDLHVVAVLGGNVNRLNGAQFLITGAPATWNSSTVVWVPADGTLGFGHPLFRTPPDDRQGVIMVFNPCQGTTSTRVPLGRLILLGAPTPDNVHLRVEPMKLFAHEPDCPIVLDCDFPVFTYLCVEGGEIVLNGTAAPGCGVAVSANTWSSVKQLYR